MSCDPILGSVQARKKTEFIGYLTHVLCLTVFKISQDAVNALSHALSKPACPADWLAKLSHLCDGASEELQHISICTVASTTLTYTWSCRRLMSFALLALRLWTQCSGTLGPVSLTL